LVLIDFYKTIISQSTGIYREKGSKFIAYASPSNSVDEAMQYVDHIKKEHPKARHHCFAYRIDPDRTQYRSNDDGEPSGTAGRPILGQIDALELTNLIIVVVRYFGGKLLGTSGLIHAYRSAAKDALDQNSIIEKEITLDIEIQFHYRLMGIIMEQVKKMKFVIVEQHFDDRPFLIVQVPRHGLEVKLSALVASVLDLPLYEVKNNLIFPDLHIRFKC
jgi:uncharacterized YigZ family protein